MIYFTIFPVKEIAREYREESTKSKKETKIELNQAGRKPEPKPEPEEDVVLPKIQTA